MEDEFSLSRELLPDELTRQFDVGNEQNWLKTRQSRDAESLFDLEEFLRGPNRSSSDDSYKSVSNHNDRLTNNEIPAASNNNDPFANDEVPQHSSADLDRRLSYIVGTPSVLLNNFKNESLLENVSLPTPHNMCNITISETPRTGDSFLQTTKKRISNLKFRLFRTPPNRKGNSENGVDNKNARDMGSVEKNSSFEITSPTLYSNLLPHTSCDNGSVPPCMNASFILVPTNEGPHENSNPDDDLTQQGDSGETIINSSKISPILKPDFPPHYTVQRKGTFVIDNSRVSENLATQVDDPDLISLQQASKVSETSFASYIRKPSVNRVSSVPMMPQQTGSRITSTPNKNQRPPLLSRLISQVPKNSLERRPSNIRRPSLTHISSLSTIPQEFATRPSSSASEKHLTVMKRHPQLSKIPNSISQVKHTNADSNTTRLPFKDHKKSLRPNPARK